MKRSQFGLVVHRLTWLMLPLLAANGLSAQKPQDTELLLDALPADSVRCGGLTFQFAKFAKDMGHHPIAGQTIEGSEKTAQGTGHGRGANMAPVRFCPVCPEGVGSSSRTTTSIWITALPCTAARPSSASSTRSELGDCCSPGAASPGGTPKPGPALIFVGLRLATQSHGLRSGLVIRCAALNGFPCGD